MKNERRSGREIRYAVLGLGFISQIAVLPAFRRARNSKLAALVSNDPAKRRSLGKRYGVEKLYGYDQYKECLKEVDVVYIALPNHLHKQYAIEAAKAGVHIICEKPLAPNEKECLAIINAADKAGVKLMTAYRLHLEPGTMAALDLVKRGGIGEPRFFTSEFTQQVPAGNVRLTEDIAAGGGPLFDMGVYCLNAARYLYQAEPVEVLAATASNGDARFRRVEEMTSAVMRFPGDRIANLVTSFGSAETDRFTIVGTEGVLNMDPAFSFSAAMKFTVTKKGKTTTHKFPKTDHFAGELTYFSDCVLRDRNPAPDGWEGLADVRAMEAMYRSARSGRAVRLREFKRPKRADISQKVSGGGSKKARAKSASSRGN